MSNSQSENTMKHVTPEEGQSANIIAENLECLRELLPDAFTENGVNFETLRQLLGDAQVLDEGEEKYGLNWHGKKKARQIALTPSTGTLLPCPEESVNWDTSQNLFIEGDNLEVLKLLQKSYANKIKMIYIDPPYNTGKEFIYPDNFAEGLDTYLSYTGQKNENNEWLTSKSGRERIGRKHSNWLSMMYPRLKLARSLLTNDGVLFISINEKEIANLRNICDELFGEENLLCQFAWRTDGNFDNQAKFKYCHEYILAYARIADEFPHPLVVDPNTPENSKLFRPEIRNTIVKNGPKNPASTITLPKGFPCSFKAGELSKRNNAWPHYERSVEVENNKLLSSVDVYSGWSSKDLLLDFIQNDCKPINDSKGQATSFEIIASGAIEIVKIRGEPSHVISSLTGLGGPQKAAGEIDKTGAVFDDYPKPLDLIKYLIRMNEGKDFIVMDFFSGSATTAHAVIEQNKEDDGTRRFIAVQLPESTIKTDENDKKIETAAYKAGFKTIFEVGLARVKGAIHLLDPIYQTLNLGFKVFKLSNSNIRVWDPDHTDLESTLLSHEEHLIGKRTEQDILYELLLKRGVDLTAPIEKREVSGKNLYSIGYGALFACLDESISRHQVEDIAQALINWYKELEPFSETHVFFRDSAFSDDVSKTNMVAILEQNGISHVRSL
ncbi:site-specific DNA-methyltransferase [Acinetobacter gerneri]|uniref:site-specific DNA-methyltransferase (adenine-specific) n=1 Tax=Acinetobacter gerneri TaxID=202952 RepID=A0AAW8JQR0_9GAMM|nr:site-specific DNA-methyltransferase [Acinetobacter gerneri]MDQ9011957.1 site-specific DNA-methyltransferase [Acinetobacter gerneri]MDQ9016066.1 site-specific DNA-methyltransferase [Acinetobacter gerneri]MDQ9027237.1 site-specific DNA-methyltransferase [Acinetobacter gerneri]MDQ9054537.1 site-specific DNA-methyltransferase [Acinetobacter gerneri]MDQ9062188.1 site-specific DNA-methyltransferase [Acinetobacter gerneri]